jgi:DNA-binding PadR family transcriptional regulator
MAVKAVIRAIIQLRDEGEPIYGYEIAQRIDVKTGTIYPILARLEHEGCMTSKIEQPAGRYGLPPRKVYMLAEGWDPSVLLG